MAVGAAYYQNTPGYGVSPALLEYFSSWGNQKVFYNAQGNRLATPQVCAAC